LRRSPPNTSFCTLVLADPDISQILFQLALIDHRADIGAGLHRVIDLQAAHPLGQGATNLS